MNKTQQHALRVLRNVLIWLFIVYAYLIALAWLLLEVQGSGLVFFLAFLLTLFMLGLIKK